MPATHALQITDLVKRYPTGVEALKGVSLEIGEGEFFGLLGPNGAGKSTLIHCTTGLAQPTGGDIRVFGHDAVHHYEQARVAVGLVIQYLHRAPAKARKRLARIASQHRNLFAHWQHGALPTGAATGAV